MTCQVPISLGELFDKYSILQIKSEKISNHDKLAAVEKEMEYLTPLVKQYNLNPMYKNLIKTVNKKLWDIEERIREKETKNEFDEEFIQLARQVYQINDERCVVKNKINVILNSDIIEVKSYVKIEQPNEIIDISEMNTTNEPNNKTNDEPNNKTNDEPNNKINDEPNNKINNEPNEIIDISETKISETKTTKPNKQSETKITKPNKQSETDMHKQALKYKNEKQHFLAIKEYTCLLEKTPTNIVYLQELAEVYVDIGLLEQTKDCLNKIYKINPNDGVNLNNLGIYYFNTANYEQAIEYFKKIIPIKNDIPDVYNNIATCYINLKKYKMAEVSLNISFKLRQDDDIYDKLAGLKFYIKQYDESISWYSKMINPTNERLYNASFPYLAKQNLKKGYKLYENRLVTNKINVQTKKVERVEISQLPYWNGVITCNHLLIIYEQGIGDNIQHFRYIIQLSQKYPAMKITYFTRETFINFLKPYDNIIVRTDKTPMNISEYNYKLYVMSLPYILKIDKITPNTENYIVQNPVRTNYWQTKLEPLKKFRVGFVYNGLLASFIEKFIPLLDFVKLNKLDIDLICLCKQNEIKNNLAEIKNESVNMDNVHFYDIDNDTTLFQDTIAIMQNIDLLITIDTAIVHLAGVMGIKTWLLLGYGSDWRWMTDPQLNNWYKTVELIRMTENIELKHIMPKVTTKLSKLLATKNKM